MTERRTTITLGWRPKGASARRHDDYLEVPHTLAPVEQQQPEPPADRRDIGSRLENWGRWNTANERRPASSPTAAFCDRLRLEAEGDTSKAPDERRRIDEADALVIEVAMRGLDTRHRLLLWWCYIKQAPPEVVCRKTGIPNQPATEFVRVFREAQASVEAQSLLIV